MDTDDEGYSSFSDMEPDPGPGYLGSSAPQRLAAGGGGITTRSGLRVGANSPAGANGFAAANGTKPGGGGMTGAAAAAAAAAAALPDLGSVLKSISVGATRLLWPPGVGEAELRSAAAAALSHEVCLHTAASLVVAQFSVGGYLEWVFVDAWPACDEASVSILGAEAPTR